MGFLSGSIFLFALRSLIPEQASNIKEPLAQNLLSKIVSEPIILPDRVGAAEVLSTYAKFEPPLADSNAPSSRSAILPPFISFLALNGNKRTAKKIPIVLLHGFDSSCLEFRRLAPLLALSRDVFIPDILGWGFNQPQDLASYSPEVKMTHLKCFVDQVVQGPCIVIGASLGGALAITLAAENPEKVSKVVLIDAQGFIDGKGPSDIPDFLARFGVNVLKSWPLRMFANYIAYADKSFATWDAMLVGRLHCFVETWEDASVSFLKSGGFIVSEKVSRVQQETLVLWGRKDEILEPSTAERFQATLPRNQLQWIEDCGHVPHLEKASETADAILRFLGDK